MIRIEQTAAQREKKAYKIPDNQSMCKKRSNIEQINKIIHNM
jgi:hypothetical protein